MANAMQLHVSARQRTRISIGRRRTVNAFLDTFWVITAYYNPARYTTRYVNFCTFRRHLNAPLLVVELARPGCHQLRKSDAERVISISGDDRIWQKERLINIGLEELPRHVEFVAWVDCDVVFATDDWPSAARMRLEKNGGLLQLFDTVVHLARNGNVPNSKKSFTSIEHVFTERAIGAMGKDGMGAAAFRRCLNPQSRRVNGDICSMGIAWAAVRATIGKCGLYDRAIVGGGDVLLVAAALNLNFERVLSRILNPAERKAIEAWAEKARSVGLFSSVEGLPHTLYHLWHGEMKDRGYGKRHRITAEYKFDPGADIELADNGTWKWTVEDSDLARAIAEYFFTRCEDMQHISTTGQAPTHRLQMPP